MLSEEFLEDGLWAAVFTSWKAPVEAGQGLVPGQERPPYRAVDVRHLDAHFLQVQKIDEALPRKPRVLPRAFSDRLVSPGRR